MMLASGEKMKFGPIGQFLIKGFAVGVLAPYLLSLCLFGTTLQTFVAGAQPTPGYWSGAATPVPTAVPSAVQVWSGNAFSAAGGALFVVWSSVGAFAGEGFAVRRWGKEWDATRRAWLGALAGSFLFMAMALCGGLLK
jgi:hypothetical protein